MLNNRRRTTRCVIDGWSCLCVCAAVCRCARNCPLYNQPVHYESLLTSLLRAADVI